MLSELFMYSLFVYGLLGIILGIVELCTLCQKGIPSGSNCVILCYYIVTRCVINFFQGMCIAVGTVSLSSDDFIQQILNARNTYDVIICEIVADILYSTASLWIFVLWFGNTNAFDKCHNYSIFLPFEIALYVSLIIYELTIFYIIHVHKYISNNELNNQTQHDIPQIEINNI